MRIFKKNLFLAALTLLIVLAGCASYPKQESTGQYIDNSVITAKVKANLANDPAIKNRFISVKTYKGSVQLSGFVDSYQEKAKAVADARRVPGVNNVVDSLVVKTY
jgi:osmotically-inducible protein OsmY